MSEKNQAGDGEKNESNESNENNQKNENNQTGGDRTALDNLPEDVQKYIRELREENAKHRNDNKRIVEENNARWDKVKNAFGGGDDLTPEQKIEALAKENEEMRAVLDEVEAERELASVAQELGIPQDKIDYFNYLLAKESQHVPEGKEVPDEVLSSIVDKVKAVSGGNQKATTTPGEKNEQGSSDAGGDDGVTYDKFLEMNFHEKTMFYRKNEQTYLKYMQKARSEGKLVR